MKNKEERQKEKLVAETEKEEYGGKEKMKFYKILHKKCKNSKATLIGIDDPSIKLRCEESGCQ